jgi:N-acyl amino acid synthase of PEP-CTERM/exosortase system
MSAPYRPVALDDSTQLLDMSYRLRYQSFCLERLFFSKDHYPAQLEYDAFDQTSVHVGVLNACDELVGTARVVKPSSAGLPLLRHCTLFPHETVLTDPSNTVVELSRVCLERRSNRRPGGDAAAPTRDRASACGRSPVQGYGHESTTDPLASLIKGMYEATKRMHGTHWIIAIEKALRRRIMRYGLPFRPAGPEADYYGPVAPYVMSLTELDEIIRSRAYPVLDDFPVDLPAEYSYSSSTASRSRGLQEVLHS